MVLLNEIIIFVLELSVMECQHSYLDGKEAKMLLAVFLRAQGSDRVEEKLPNQRVIIAIVYYVHCHYVFVLTLSFKKGKLFSIAFILKHL